MKMHLYWPPLLIGSSAPPRRHSPVRGRSDLKQCCFFVDGEYLSSAVHSVAVASSMPDRVDLGKTIVSWCLPGTRKATATGQRTRLSATLVMMERARLEPYSASIATNQPVFVTASSCKR